MAQLRKKINASSGHNKISGGGQLADNKTQQYTRRKINAFFGQKNAAEISQSFKVNTQRAKGCVQPSQQKRKTGHGVNCCNNLTKSTLRKKCARNRGNTGTKG